MSDLQAIQSVLIRYATGIDSRDWPLFRSCFAPTCHFDYGAIGRWDNPDELTRYMELAHSGPSMHRLGNFDITIEGDQARARTYVDAIVYGPGNWICAQSVGVYDDELQRAASGWVITRRRYTQVRMSFLGLLALLPDSLASYLGAAGARRIASAAKRDRGAMS